MSDDGPTGTQAEMPAVVDIAVASQLLGENVHVLAIAPNTHRPTRRWVWLLHGHGVEPAEIRNLLAQIVRAISDGQLPPHIVVAPLAPWMDGGSWWVDSAYAGDATVDTESGRPIESVMLTEVLPQLEAAWGTPDRDDRVVAGISMGGAAALRWALVHRALFSSGVLLSPSVYAAGPHHASSARSTGAFGVGHNLWDAERYRTLVSYPDLLAARPIEGQHTKIVTVVGDGEVAMDQGGPITLEKNGPIAAVGERRDLDLEAARLHSALKERPDIQSALRVVAGGHNWDLWRREIVSALRLAG